jgi:hypothetical protein
MRKVAGVLAVIGFAGLAVANPMGNFISEVNGKYISFSGSSKELKSLTQLKVKGIYYNPTYGIRIKIGDTFQAWKYQSWVKDLMGDDSINVHIPFIQVGKFWKTGLYTAVGFMYVNADTENLTADGAFDINLTLEGQLNKLARIGLFNSYFRVANGDANADIFQVSPYLLVNGQKLYGKIFLSAQEVAYNLGGDSDKKVYARGGLEVGVRITPKVNVVVGGEYGKGLYWINPNGEDIEPLARINNGKAYVKVAVKPIEGKNLVLTGGIEYQSWKDLDYAIKDWNNQNGFGITLGVAYQF